eukprot:9412919-Pyramimonas_sp.AAC.2
MQLQCKADATRQCKNNVTQERCTNHTTATQQTQRKTMNTKCRAVRASLRCDTLCLACVLLLEMLS